MSTYHDDDDDFMRTVKEMSPKLLQTAARRKA